MSSISDHEFILAAGLALGSLVVLTIINVIINRKKQSTSNALRQTSSLRDERSVLSEKEHTSQPEQKHCEEQELSKPASASQQLFEAKAWTDRLKFGLRKTRNQIVLGLQEFLSKKQEHTKKKEALEFLFELLVQADVGVKTSKYLVDQVTKSFAQNEAFDFEKLQFVLKQEILALFASAKTHPKGVLESVSANPSENQGPHVVLVVGVNGVGKTTTTGKLAFKASKRGQKVVIGAADTFRAAAVEQLAVWAERSHAVLVRLQEKADPASVAYETVKKAKHSGAAVCFVDTAGRLHNRQDLMQELGKIRRVLSKEHPEAPHEVLLILDATTGQNALWQAKAFTEIVQVTGLVLTKLDGTAKGGIAIAIVAELGIPIRYVGVGESVEDLEVFDSNQFVHALFDGAQKFVESSSASV
jgi:fused signal recognition particle receptor